ncbi:hypothetical protein AYI70_g3783 [Smittium culicis]|uniref:Uncharacterized protein n=1 Tax=Smittium culicis TaxID=133412 RepID=A0A1R1Y2H0_9FUNG|nr:hypothetical protein AYI70_g3783 [Smittium culicis]
MIEIQSCLKTSSMNYTPPPLNDTASSTVKKTDSAFYGIQLALAQAARPIDYSVHRQVQENKRMDISEGLEIIFASTMRALLSKIASTVTQATLDNLHKGFELPGKLTQLVESDVKPLMDQEVLDVLIVKNPTAKRKLIRPFRRCQKSTISKNTDSSNTVKASRTASETTAEASLKIYDRQSNFHGRDRGRGNGS